jgi:hypothetical protein
MRNLRLLLPLLTLLAGPALADETIVLQRAGGQRQEVQVKLAFRDGGKVKFERSDGQRFEVPEAEVVQPALDQLPVLLRFKTGKPVLARQVARDGGQVAWLTLGGERGSAAEAEVQAPALAAIPAGQITVAVAPPPTSAPVATTVELVLTKGRKVTARQAVRDRGKVKFELPDGQRFEVAQSDVQSPALDDLPFLARPKGGAPFVATGIASRAGGQLELATPDGASRSLAEADLAEPPVASLAYVVSLQDGRKLVARSKVLLAGGQVRLEPGAKGPFAVADVASSLQSLPTQVQAGGRSLLARSIAWDQGKVAIETTDGKRVELAEAELASPPIEAIPALLRVAGQAPFLPTKVTRWAGRVDFEREDGSKGSVDERKVSSPPLDRIVCVMPRGAKIPGSVRVAETAPPEPPKHAYATIASRWGLFEGVPCPAVLKGKTGKDSLCEDGVVRLDRADRRWVDSEGFNPYRSNTLKGDKPIAGDDLFFVLTASLDVPTELKRVYLPSGVSAAEPHTRDFFGDGSLFFTSPRATVSLELFKGQTSFKPKTFALKVTGAGNLNYLRSREQNVVNIDPREGKTRRREDASLEEAFLEVKLADLSPKYDTISVRAGIQPFVSDFRGFVFSDFNLGARLFGNASNNRWQYNLAYFDLLEKETNSELNLFEKRDQKVMIANLFRQDAFRHGHTLLFSYHRSQDEASKEPHYDANDFLVRPAKIGTPRLHDVTSNYAGVAGDGHLGRLNVDYAGYYAFGTDDDHPLGARLDGAQDIRAGMGGLELSIDKDWFRPKLTVFFASGDDDASDGKATGFDSIYDNVNFAGGPFSFWVRSGIPLTQTAVLLKTPGSLLPSLRSNKFEGQANFVNPGLMLAGLSFDADLTPKIKAVVNANYLRFHRTGALDYLLFQDGIRKDIGIDVGGGLIWRPDLSENVVVTAGVTGLLPGKGFDDLFSSPCAAAPECGQGTRKLYNAFLQLKLSY